MGIFEILLFYLKGQFYLSEQGLLVRITVSPCYGLFEMDSSTICSAPPFNNDVAVVFLPFYFIYNFVCYDKLVIYIFYTN